jgi:hypothetical protein
MHVKRRGKVITLIEVGRSRPCASAAAEAATARRRRATLS